ncbi:MAG: ferredoxin family protein [Dehalococcoidales bacterium]|nr:ferredoxin family protein [Dehalococcoidales bacterium]
MATQQPTWHGISRQEIPWYPTVDKEKCIGCELCYVTCGRGVYEMAERKSVVANPYNCMVGCSTCGVVCPTQAISFPSRDLIWKVERENKIFKLVKEEAAEKRAKQGAQRARAAAEAEVTRLTTRVKVEIAGGFGEKRFLVQLQDLVKGQPFDITNLKFEVPTVQGSLERTPSYMSFDVTSTTYEDVEPFLERVRELVRTNDLVWVSEAKQ